MPMLYQTIWRLIMTDELFEAAKQVIPGGVNSPVRAFQAVSGVPVFFDHAKEALLYDTKGNSYIDYVCSWGALILGHAHPEIVKAIQQATTKGLSFGAPTPIETQLAKMIISYMPSIEKIRMVNSGTEAAMSAIRLARGYSSRDKIVKFDGCYHGHVDALLVKAGSGGLTFGLPTSKGVPEDVVKHTITLTYNDSEAVDELFKQMGDSIAAVIVEPIAGNMNCIPSTPDFLATLRASCDEYGAVLIFDEVMSGFRVALGGAQSLYDIQPDLSILAKVIGGGLPVGAFGGRAEIMDHIAPSGEVYQAGTLSGNPITMTAGLSTLALLADPNIYKTLQTHTTQLTQGLKACAAQYDIALQAHAIGGMFGIFFSHEQQLRNSNIKQDLNQFKSFFHGMLKHGVYFAPSAYEAGFISLAHNANIIDETLNIADDVFKKMMSRK